MKNILDIPRTAMEVFNMLPEGTLCEVIDNVLYMSPAPTTDHQRILLDVVFEIKLHLKTKQVGQVFIAPCDVFLDDEQSVVEPDIVFIGDEKSSLVHRRGILGAPDMVIEILSTNVNYDKKRKLDLYERNGIPEYIIIDPDTKEIWQYLLVNGRYQRKEASQAGQLFINCLSLSVSF